MYLPDLDQLDRRTLKFNGPLPSLLEAVASGGPLYVHARNWLAELAAIVPLSNMVIDETEHSIFFLEQGLHLSLDAVQAVHGVVIDYRTQLALSIEIATRGEPLTLSLVAIPNISNTEQFTRCLQQHPAEILREEDYRRWRSKYSVRPLLCPCCETAAAERRSNPEKHPLMRILYRSVDLGLDLQCHLISPAVGFTTWLRPTKLQIFSGLVRLLAEDGKSMLEIDLGICHMLRICCRSLDDEPFTEVMLYDSLGKPHLTISSRGWDMDAEWRRLCG